MLVIYIAYHHLETLRS